MGEWRKFEVTYLTQNRTHCDLCGQLRPGRCWAAEVEGKEQKFCSPEHEQKFRAYWLPRYGKAAR